MTVTRKSPKTIKKMTKSKSSATKPKKTRTAAQKKRLAMAPGGSAALIAALSTLAIANKKRMLTKREC